MRQSLLFLTLLLCAGCADKKTALLWVSQPEFVIYVQYYNTSQSKYKIETQYVESPAAELKKAKRKPDIIISDYLDNREMLAVFEDIRYLFSNGYVNDELFYPELLKTGRIGRAQRLLPVSFNLPMIVFSADGQAAPEDPFVIDIDTLRKSGIAYNKWSSSAWTQIGFSPLWDKKNDFVFLVSRMYNTSFSEAAKNNSKKNILKWDNTALEASLQYISDWTAESTHSVQSEDEFVYKYFFDPVEKLLLNERILFAYMDSSSYFTLYEGQSNQLNFRWLAGESKIPVLENNVSFGICRSSKSKKAAADFSHWFFNEDTQRLFLEMSFNNKLNTFIFGIAGGFSAMQSVSEFIFSQYYDSLLGYMPPAGMLSVQSSLPSNWPEIKETVIIPYMLSEIRGKDKSALQDKINDWKKIKQGQF
ncbi:MAG: hypothetical protein LBD07_03670 [Spirochaetaceae bacterium]|jgi:hypothetical protein|nr:hypothetical protein [Spirochaetaceae bacterium]